MARPTAPAPMTAIARASVPSSARRVARSAVPHDMRHAAAAVAVVVHDQLVAERLGGDAKAGGAVRAQPDDGADLARGVDEHRRQATAARDGMEGGAAGGEAGAGERDGAQEFAARRGADHPLS